MKWPLLMLAVFLGACAPRIQPPGPGPATPALTAEHLLMDDGAVLPLRVWRPDGEPRAVVLALHGFNDYSKAFEEPAKRLASHGIVTYAFDQRGFGETPHRGVWPGEMRMIEDLRIAAGLIREENPGRPLYLMGESMGGAVIMAACTADPPIAADGYVLAAPAVWGREAQGARHRVGDVEGPVKLAIEIRVLELPHRRDVGEPDGACVARAAPVNDERVVGNVCGQDPRRAWELRVRRVGRPPDRPLREIQLRARREGRWNQPR